MAGPTENWKRYLQREREMKWGWFRKAVKAVFGV